MSIFSSINFIRVIGNLSQKLTGRFVASNYFNLLKLQKFYYSIQPKNNHILKQQHENYQRFTL